MQEEKKGNKIPCLPIFQWRQNKRVYKWECQENDLLFEVRLLKPQVKNFDDEVSSSKWRHKKSEITDFALYSSSFITSSSVNHHHHPNVQKWLFCLSVIVWHAGWVVMSWFWREMICKMIWKTISRQRICLKDHSNLPASGRLSWPPLLIIFWEQVQYESLHHVPYCFMVDYPLRMLFAVRKALPKTLSRRGLGRCSSSFMSSEWETSSTWSEKDTLFLTFRLTWDAGRLEGWPDRSSLQDEDMELLLSLTGMLSPDLSPHSEILANDCFSGRELDKEVIDLRGWETVRFWLLWGILWTEEVTGSDDVDWVTTPEGIFEVDTLDRDNLCMAVI